MDSWNNAGRALTDAISGRRRRGGTSASVAAPPAFVPLISRASPVSTGAGRRTPWSASRTQQRSFLSSTRIAVTSVSRNAGGHGSNAVYRRLRDRGYEVFAVNPNADEVEGDRCYHELRGIPGGVDAVVIATRPERAEQTMGECAELGIEHAWMHPAFGDGWVCADATASGRDHGITVIDGGCPLMFEPTAAFPTR
jgi:predicted CoA-binding protein